MTDEPSRSADIVLDLLHDLAFGLRLERPQPGSRLQGRSGSAKDIPATIDAPFGSDLAPFALSASLLMTIGQMGFFVAGEFVAMDRGHQLLDIIAASPASYVVILAGRVGILTALGLLGFFEGWLIAWGVLSVHVPIVHCGILVAALLATVIASTGTALLFTALLGLASTTRTFQHAVNGPFDLLGGVLVPVHFLPTWLQSLAPLTFFY